MTLFEYEFNENIIIRRCKSEAYSHEVDHLLEKIGKTLLIDGGNDLSLYFVVPLSQLQRSISQELPLEAYFAFVKGKRGKFITGGVFEIGLKKCSNGMCEVEERIVLGEVKRLSNANIAGTGDVKSHDATKEALDLALADDMNFVPYSRGNPESITREGAEVQKEEVDNDLVVEGESETGEKDIILISSKIMDFSEVFGNEKTDSGGFQHLQMRVCMISEDIAEDCILDRSSGDQSTQNGATNPQVVLPMENIKPQDVAPEDVNSNPKAYSHPLEMQAEMLDELPYFGSLKSPRDTTQMIKKRIKYSAFLRMEEYGRENRAIEYLFAEMKQFIIQFNDITEAERTRRFRSTCERLSSLTLLAKYDPDDIYNSVERYLCEGIGANLIPRWVVEADEKFNLWIQKISFMSGRHMDIPAPLVVHPLLYKAEDGFKEIANMLSPEIVLQKVIKNILTLVEVISSSVDSKGNRFVPSADNLLPLLTYCLVKSNPKSLKSVIYLIVNYRSEHRIMDEANYLFTHFVSAIRFIENINPDSLSIDKEEFYRLLKENEASISERLASSSEGETILSKFNPFNFLYPRRTSFEVENEGKSGEEATEIRKKGVKSPENTELAQMIRSSVSHGLEFELEDIGRENDLQRQAQREMEVYWKNLVGVEESSLYRYTNSTPYSLSLGDIPELLACYKALVMQNRIQTMKIRTLETDLEALNPKSPNSEAVVDESHETN